MKPLYDSDGFIAYCREQLRKGLGLRYWITLPFMWRKELKFRRELEAALNSKDE